jgi:hypothetical protein
MFCVSEISIEINNDTENVNSVLSRLCLSYYEPLHVGG